MKYYHSLLVPDAVFRYKTLYPKRPVRPLVSYAYRDKNTASFLIKNRDKIDGLITDSGTFTLNSNPKKYAKKITFDGYKSFLKTLDKDGRMDFYFNFDSDFSKNGFQTNYSYQLDLEKEGLNPVPVIHDCYGKEIQTYIDRGYEMLAIGSGELKYAGLDDLRHIVDPLYRRGIKVHFLGCTEFRKLAYLPVYSADSSTCSKAGRSGRIFWNPLKSGHYRLDEIVLDDNIPKSVIKYHINDYKFRDQLEQYLDKELGLSIEDLMSEDWAINRALVNIHCFVLLEELINKMHEEQGFKAG